jgi:hypothetical protein
MVVEAAPGGTICLGLTGRSRYRSSPSDLRHRRSESCSTSVGMAPGLLTWSEIWCHVDNSERFRSSCSRPVSQGHRLKGVAALHNFLASIFTAPGVTTWRDISGNTRKNQVIRLVTLRHQSTMSGALGTGQTAALFSVMPLSPSVLGPPTHGQFRIAGYGRRPASLHC